MEKKKSRTWFWILNVLIAVVVVVFVVENWAEVSLKFFGMEIRGYGFLVFPAIFLLGFLAGWLWSVLHRLRKKKKANEEEFVKYIEEK